MFEAGMLSDVGFWLLFGLPAEFLRGLTNVNSLSADKQNKHSRCTDKLTNKQNKLGLLLATQISSDVEMTDN